MHRITTPYGISESQLVRDRRTYQDDTALFVRRFAPRGRDPAQADENLYRYCDNEPTEATDPSGLLTIHSIPNRVTLINTDFDPDADNVDISFGVSATWRVNNATFPASGIEQQKIGIVQVIKLDISSNNLLASWIWGTNGWEIDSENGWGFTVLHMGLGPLAAIRLRWLCQSLLKINRLWARLGISLHAGYSMILKHMLWG